MRPTTKRRVSQVLLAVLLVLLNLGGICFGSLAEEKTPAEQVSKILGDPMDFVSDVEAEAFKALGEFIGALVTVMGFKMLISAIFNPSK